MNSFITSTRIEEAGRMKKVLVLVTLLLGMGIVAGCMNTPSKEKMNEELQKPEVVEVIEEAIKKWDSKALTEVGKIKTYNVDYDKTYYNPMGGINFTIYINGDRNLNIQDTLNKYSRGYSLGAKLISPELSHLLRELRILNDWLYRGK